MILPIVTNVTGRYCNHRISHIENFIDEHELGIGKKKSNVSSMCSFVHPSMGILAQNRLSPFK